RNVAEVIILYPGFHVLVTHKIAHFLYCHKCFFLARLISQLARHLTGIE
ncbi:MAG TPA: serine O-acetyltransferase, partial [Ruminococcaceae bacterium]|nr:serine O-acetyltransferase [Oscillospiraceae bacterium]